jgi:hypothetical protein
MYELICPRCDEPRYGENRQECARKMQLHMKESHGLSPHLPYLRTWATEMAMLPKEVEAAQAAEVAGPHVPAAVQEELPL